MEYLTAKQTGEKWGITLRRIQELCRTGKIGGVVRHGREWMIPADAPRPVDRRRREHKDTDTNALMPRRSPFIAMTDLYSIPGSADRVYASLSDRPETAALFGAQISLYRGEFDKAYHTAQHFLKSNFTYNKQVGAGLLLSRCAVFKGDISLWRDARKYIYETPCSNPEEKKDLEFWLAAADSGIHDIVNYPEWFSMGCFDPLPRDSYPAARYYYLRYHYTLARQHSMDKDGTVPHALFMYLLPVTGEPLISQTRSDGAILAEIYLLLTCAVAYHITNRDDLAIKHIDRAIDLSVPDRLLVPLAEHRRPLDFLLDERINAKAPQYLKKIRALAKTINDGWTKLHNSVLGHTISSEFTTREYEVARLAVYGFSNKEIADQLKISVNSVKHALRTAMDKTGANRRSDLNRYIW